VLHVPWDEPDPVTAQKRTDAQGDRPTVEMDQCRARPPRVLESQNRFILSVVDPTAGNVGG
jgi:hypothetical protein